MQTAGLPLDEWLALLETYSPQEIDLGLERVQLLLQRMDLPQPDLVLHIAGTNGKGSSAAMLESLLRQSALKVGCFTSPHIQRYNERIRVDGVEASDTQIVAAFEKIDALRGDLALTYFEFGTLAALAVFAEVEVDVAVLEIGMGGRLDAVNAVEPTASLITNVSLDHCAWLGDDVASIAVEKAGVMRSGRPTVFAAPEMPNAIVESAESIGAKLIAANRDYQWSVNGDSWTWRGVSRSIEQLARPSLLGDIQIQNAAGVLTLLEQVGLDDLLNAATVNSALGDLQLTGRAQLVGANWMVDVAHNAAAAEVMASVLATQAHGKHMIVVLGMLDDKDVAGVVAPLAPYADVWIAVTADNPRAIPAKELARRVANETDSACLIADSVESAIESAEQMVGADDLILATGSFYVVNGILAALGQHHG
ncbi:MAG: bifunctional folylpolyglutamate synthase/dihydrofolate synthase [Woeseiaceae bacterium]